MHIIKIKVIQFGGRHLWVSYLLYIISITCSLIFYMHLI